MTESQTAIQKVLWALESVSRKLSGYRVWRGMEWEYHPLTEEQYLPLRATVDAQIRALTRLLTEPPNSATDVVEPIGEIFELHGLLGVSIPKMPPAGTKLYAAPLEREWQGLTDDKIKELANQSGADSAGLNVESASVLNLFKRFARTIAAKEREACAKIVDDETYNGWVLRNVYFEDGEPLMHSDPEWQGLTYEEVENLCMEFVGQFQKASFARAIEAKLKSKNGY